MSGKGGTARGGAGTAPLGTALGIELGSTRIKACLIDDASGEVLATGSFAWENRYVDGLWSYDLDEVWAGVSGAFAALAEQLRERTGVRLERVGAIGVSAMMHGYLAFDARGEQLVPFRSWRNTNTGPAAERLSALFGRNIPLRWSIAHLYQAMLDAEPHLPELDFCTTLAGYVHWRLTGERVLGVGDASGMFPIDGAGRDYDPACLAAFDALAGDALPPAARGGGVRALLPSVLPAGAPAGRLTAEGARLLDPSGVLQPGAPLCPPEGDAGTGMVATGAVAPRTANVSVGTSVFAMVVLERPLRGAHPEVDPVTTPAGHPVAMVHCNNGASELAAWAEVFGQFAAALGHPAGSDEVFRALYAAAGTGAADAGGILTYNQISGEPVAGLAEGRPLIVRTPGSELSLANLMRAQLYGVFAALSLGLEALSEESVEIDRMHAHGGVFRTAGVAQQALADALDAPVSVAETASEGGAWGMALLAAYLGAAAERPLGEYLDRIVRTRSESAIRDPHPESVAAYRRFLARYRSGLAAVAAAAALPAN
ncbi:xylulokinase [Leucobacter massiliensis]|uniref:ATPase n=1 Tax=Leucobacter massiliensis TaxID=1686285 RepID=A0A2S9QRU0_9MICO|nr:FGGY-family carbohydrate kinase [Leucobacter massiliensis]PRI12304.1 ATPase [Leucobacter massiliensis]